MDSIFVNSLPGEIYFVIPFPPRLILLPLSWSFVDMSKLGKFWVTQRVCSQLRLNNVMLCLLVSALLMFFLQSSTMFICFFYICAFVDNFAVWNSHKPSAEVLSSVSVYKAVICLIEKIMCVRYALFKHELQCSWLWVHC